MAQRKSGYERKERDLYETPPWVTQAIIPYIPAIHLARIWEPACGSGKMAHVLNARYASDLVTYYTKGVTNKNFLEQESMPGDCTAIVTNPPFNREAQKFIRHGLNLLGTRAARGQPGFMAMLLPVDFDSGKTRRDMFNDSPHYAGKLVLTSRIIWFERDDGTDNPSANHAWFFWNTEQGTAMPTINYHFKPD